MKGERLSECWRRVERGSMIGEYGGEEKMMDWRVGDGERENDTVRR